MALIVGTDKVSNMQMDYLRQAKSASAPVLADLLLMVCKDRDLRSGKEYLHPDWLNLFRSQKASIMSTMSRNELAIIERELKVPAFDPEIENINPNALRIAFLLGAGASNPKPSGIPTVKELLPDLLTRARRLDRSDLNRLADFCEQSRIDNIEDLLTAAQLSEFCSRNSNCLKLVDFLTHGRKEEPETELDLSRRTRRGFVPPLTLSMQPPDLSGVAFLQDTLQVLFALLSSRMLPAQPNDGHIAIAAHARKRTDSAIVTTNYDCCMDLALGEGGKDFAYLVDFANMHSPSPPKKGTTPLIKLHGSLNWYYCDTCQKVHLIDIKKTVHEYTRNLNSS